jgi:antirestriction protein
MTTTTATEAAAFFYIDGIPTKGAWVELDASTTWETIADAIREKIPGASIDEILCADAEGLARHFLSRYDGFDLKGWKEWIEAAEASNYDPEIIAAYCDNVGDWTTEAVSTAEDCYFGEHESAEDFAAELLENTGELASIPESLRYYFDFEKYARDLLSGDFFESNGHYFRNQ